MAFLFTIQDLTLYGSEESMPLRQGDTLVLYGTLEDLRQAKKHLLSW